MPFIVGALIGGLFAAIVVWAYLAKSIEDLNKSYDDLKERCEKIIRSYKNVDFINSKLIANQATMITSQRKVIQDTYSYLVNLRDHDAGNLDDIIGTLGEILDDHKEDSDESDSD